MKRGGWAHFEGGKGLGHVKHPCFNRGEGLGRRRDNETPDLFKTAAQDVDGWDEPGHDGALIPLPVAPAER
jgi:hypothetical protein